MKAEQEEFIRGKLYPIVAQSHFIMESFTLELVSYASTQKFTEKSIGSLTNFLPYQLNEEGQWVPNKITKCYGGENHFGW